MNLNRSSLGTYVPMDEGLNTVQKKYLQEEILKNHNRPTVELREIAIRKASERKAKRVFSEIMALVGLGMSLLFIAVVLLVIFES
ncbi:hypothetical protein OM416_19215 [Paenibacillus sp. LS1]|uniref:hypothetical protein n=1 Tax=Paenibacillus sp. LS1 TaxID=2992120 RepID=UPI0022304C9C|nr:hypothetical protein [Paenibacillus sp. LS1]MCW3793726.1 hypothetical protein [Paenibacillus sp. LS1]